MSSIKTSDVSTFIKDMVEMTMVYEVDESGYVVKKESGDRVLVSEGGVQYPLVIYQEVITDASAKVVNPLAEGLGFPISSLWFYNVQKTALLGRIFTLFAQVIKTALDEKKNKKDKDLHIPMELLNVASKIIDEVDDRLLKEFVNLTQDKETNEFITIYYQRKQLRSVLRCALFDVEDTSVSAEMRVPLWKDKFPSVRRKTWELLERVMLAILNIDDKDGMSKFTRKADEISCTRLSSFLNVLLAVYQEINPLLDAISPDISIDLSKIVFHLNRLSAYADNAKFMLQPSQGVIPTSTHTPNIVPGAMPIVPMATQAYSPAPSPMMQPGVSLVPGPSFVDGRTTPPTPVMASGGYGQQGGYGQVPQPMTMHGGYPPQGGYMQPQPYGYVPPQQGYVDPNSIPFAGPYIPAQSYMQGGGMGGINILPPGAPGGLNLNFR